MVDKQMARVYHMTVSEYSFSVDRDIKCPVFKLVILGSFFLTDTSIHLNMCMFLMAICSMRRQY
ncbi:hypothetical protein SAMN02745945_02146 [Peptoclostridium litorale DSM 5388]|uniref:Uncharacterized protein n=1 Tax=Peptoclostridium litorale DSM 5388 TaxID=1121324 RepID=A0A069REE6_PEPLI|nr:hypothetical protein CLIT_10c01380 [Peptoclostridium litorale DSM 5388]SIO19334.1 hypothetical protein SAMN02745945_02146 [Peptoclostridium litorale DSM 5388]